MRDRKLLRLCATSWREHLFTFNPLFILESVEANSAVQLQPSKMKWEGVVVPVARPPSDIQNFGVANKAAHAGLIFNFLKSRNHAAAKFRTVPSSLLLIEAHTSSRAPLLWINLSKKQHSAEKSWRCKPASILEMDQSCQEQKFDRTHPKFTLQISVTTTVKLAKM